MLTPQEVSQKVFPKASFGSGGYAMAQVDEFLDVLTEAVSAEDDSSMLRQGDEVIVTSADLSDGKVIG